MTSHPTPLSDARIRFILAVLIGLLVLAFAAATHSVWEDYYITFRSSKNLIDGHGLVYTQGDRLHTFTSPLGVLLPALTYAITGSDSGAIWLFRGLCAAALGTSAWILTAALQAQRWSRVACVLACVLGLASLKNLEFASNGMESAFLVLFTLLAFAELIRPEGLRVRRLALAFAGLMWTRPDAFIIAGGLALGALLFAEKSERPALLKKGLCAAGLGLALYAPWLIFATAYYGSPVPHTITAKANLPQRAHDLQSILTTPLRMLASNGVLAEAAGPDYHRIQRWGENWTSVWGLLMRVAAFAWIWPGLSRAARLASFAVMIGGIYLEQVVDYPWYFTPWIALAGVALAGFCAAGWRKSGSLVRIGAAVAVLSGVVVLTAGAITAAKRQTLIEEEVRGRIGLWLKDHAREGDTVFLEPIGYIGYFSDQRIRILDYPGLTSREVSTQMAQGVRSVTELVRNLRPRWLVLRPGELPPAASPEQAFEPDYAHRALFSNRGKIEAADTLPGRAWMLYDSEFHVFERRPEAGR